MTNDAYTVTLPEVQTSSMVFASPHSGRFYSREFLRRTVLDDVQIRSSEDAFMDQLIAPATQFGVPILTATVPRAYLDLNRACDELDPAVVQGVRRRGHNPRIASGLGVIPRVVANGRAIYSGKITLEEANTRIDRYWRPYHDRLGDLMAQTKQSFGRAVLVDFHSMPHEAVRAMTHSGLSRPEVVLGDRFGAAAHGDINTITLLLGAEEAGLELLTAQGDWKAVAPPEGALVVNVGDMLQRLTNDVLCSTTHRVVNPPPPICEEPRFSMPFFHHPNPEFLIETLPGCITAENPNRYPASITAGDYLTQRLVEIGLLPADRAPGHRGRTSAS